MTQITLLQVEQMCDKINSGNRAGAYLQYFDLIKGDDLAAAKHVLIEAQVSSYSGFFGGAALIGNAIAKQSQPALGEVDPDVAALIRATELI